MPLVVRILSRVQDLDDFQGPLTDGYFVKWDSASGKFVMAPAGGKPAGSSSQLQYNNAGAFAGTAAVTYSPSGSILTATAQAATDKPLVVKGAASQSANLQEWQDSTGTVLATVSPSGQVGLAAGTVSAPSLNWGDATSGLYRSAANEVSFALGGLRKLTLNNGDTFSEQNFNLNAGATLSWSASVAYGGLIDLRLFRDAANTLAQRNGVNPQTLRVYNTYTDANNGEWLEASWASNVCTLRTNANGTGSTRPIKIIGKSPSGSSYPVLEITNSAGEFFCVGLRISSQGYGSNVDVKMGSVFQILTSGAAGYNQISMGGVGGAYIPFNLYTAATSTQRLLLTTVDAASKGLVVQGAASQSANLQEWQSSTGALTATIGAGNPSVLNLYSSYTDSTHYVRGSFTWTGSGFTLGTATAPAGFAQAITIQPGGTLGWQFTSSNIGSYLVPLGDNTQAIGLAGSRLSNVYAGTSFTHLGANGQSLAIQSVTEAKLITPLPTAVTTIQVPAGAILLAVNVRVVQSILGATSFTVKGTTTGTVYTGAVPTASGSTDPGVTNLPVSNPTAQTLTITPNTTPTNGSGVVRVTAYYMLSTPPTS